MLAEKEAPVKKKIVEVLGSYNPRKKVFQAKEDRLKYWIAQRVELSETMHNLLVDKKFVDAKKIKAFNIPEKVKVEEKKEAAPAAVTSEATAEATKAEAEKLAAEPVAESNPAEAEANPPAGGEEKVTE